MTNTTSVTPTTQQPNGATSIQANQSASGATSNEATNNGSQTSATTQQAKKDDGVMAWLGRNWGWVLAGVTVVGLGVYFLVRKHNKDKDKDKIYDTQENVDKMFKLADVSNKAQNRSPSETMIVKGKNGNYVRLNRDGTYSGIDYNVKGGRHYYDPAQNAYVTSASTSDAYNTKTSYTPNGNIQFTSSSTVNGTVSITYDSAGSKVLSETKTPANSQNNGTLAKNGQRYTEENNLNINNNDYSR